MLEIRILPLGPLQTNCYLVACDETNQAAVIDPAWNGSQIASLAQEEGWQITQLLLTHSHFDHVGGLADLKEATQAPILIHDAAIPMLRQAPQAAARWGFELTATPEPEQRLEAGQKVAVGKHTFTVLYTPGHAPGHVSFYNKQQGILFDGDVLFQQGIGRTDLPGGDYRLLMQSIREQLLTLPDETRVFHGHGNPTTIGEEKRLNPFLRE
jgi:glyoxylase-like metal-dependent hydrolase (beta-lactamase superfamily II)